MLKSTGLLYLLFFSLLTIFFTIPLSAQGSDTLFYDSFEDMSNWTPVGPEGLQSWEMSNSNNAGGLAAPEIRFNWIYPFIGESYLLANPVFSGIQGHNMQLKFNYYEDWWSNIVYVGVAITSDGGNTYNSIWELQASGNSGPELITVNFTGIDNMQVALYYLGDSNDIDFWYVDDLTLIDLDIVPVELTSFTARVLNGNVILKWITATETNNKGFEIQKKQSDDSGKKPDWTEIGFIEGNGTSSKSNSYSFTDNNIHQGNYFYRLKQIDYNGSFEYSNTIEVAVTVPSEFILEQNYPNPFNPSTRIGFALPIDASVKITVYNMLGQQIAKVVNNDLTAGNHNVNFNASSLSSGLYFYTLEANGTDGSKYTSTKKMILMK
jgi:hypothetical protein